MPDFVSNHPQKFNQKFVMKHFYIVTGCYAKNKIYFNENLLTMQWDWSDCIAHFHKVTMADSPNQTNVSACMLIPDSEILHLISLQTHLLLCFCILSAIKYYAFTNKSAFIVNIKYTGGSGVRVKNK